MLAAIPYPPTEKTVDTTGQWVMALGTSAALAVALVLTISFAVRRREAWPIVILISAAFCSLMEAIYDNSFNLWFYTGPDFFTGYSGMGIHVPWWVPVTYVWVYGAQAVWLAHRIESGATRRDVSLYSVALWVVFTGFEMVGTNVGTYDYFGEHPYRVAGFPIWVSVANTGIVVVAAVAVTKLRHLLPGFRIWALLVLMPGAFGLATFAPSFMTIEVISHENPNTALMWISATGSMVLGATLCYLACLFVPQERPGVQPARSEGIEELVPDALALRTGG
ncbi:hypothetical protein [Sporichthya sp.]|uniref:hypothetical protein n=1 Tax=Sporichthya sp. TaxID=65475 RepID=UPI0017B6678D|nr:hypothetical protein [Sporichthya sp.]MBA3741980.1 hypothetical protein [Sporichthya sp.]